jgi:hypothetical protein
MGASWAASADTLRRASFRNSSRSSRQAFPEARNRRIAVPIEAERLGRNSAPRRRRRTTPSCSCCGRTMWRGSCAYRAPGCMRRRAPAEFPRFGWEARMAHCGSSQPTSSSGSMTLGQRGYRDDEARRAGRLPLKRERGRRAGSLPRWPPHQRPGPGAPGARSTARLCRCRRVGYAGDMAVLPRIPWTASGTS